MGALGLGSGLQMAAAQELPLSLHSAGPSLADKLWAFLQEPTPFAKLAWV